MDELITTTEAAKIAGVGVSSIKRWSDQSLIEVVRTPGGHRRVVKANFMRFLRDAGSPFRNRGSKFQLTRAHEPADNGSGSPPATSPSSSDAEWADTIVRGDVYEIQAALLQARSRLGSWFPTADEACLGLREIGLRWQRGELSVLDEHVASERLTRSLSIITEAMPSSASDPVCILACAENESHTLGLSFLQVCLREIGWHPLWVGASTPTEYVCKAAASDEIQMVALSASAASNDAAHLARIVDHMEKCCQESGTHLVLGGRGAWPESPAYGFRFNTFSDLEVFLSGVK